jgi:hypothetical protein
MELESEYSDFYETYQRVIRIRKDGFETLRSEVGNGHDVYVTQNKIYLDEHFGISSIDK